MDRIKMDPKKMGEKAEGLIDSAKGTVKDVVKNVTSEVQERFEAAQDVLNEYREKDFDEILGDAKGFVSNYPIPTILGALFIGYGLGRLFGGRSND